MFRVLTALPTRRPGLVMVVFAAIVGIAVVVGTPVVGLLVGGGFDDPGSQSAAADRQLERASGFAADQGLLVVVRTPDGVTSPTGRAKIVHVAGVLPPGPHVVSPADYLRTPPPALLPPH